MSGGETRAGGGVRGRKKRGKDNRIDPKRIDQSITILPPPFSSALTISFPDAVDKAAAEWADDYEADRAAATAALLSLLVQAAGADAAVSPDYVESGEADDLVARLVTAVTSGGVADPFKAAGKGAKRARDAYGELWRGAVGALASRGLLGDGYFVDKATAVLLGMSRLGEEEKGVGEGRAALVSIGSTDQSIDKKLTPPFFTLSAPSSAPFASSPPPPPPTSAPPSCAPRCR